MPRLQDIIFEQASRYRQRGGRRIPLPPKLPQPFHPDLIPPQTPAENVDKQILENSNRRILEMQLALEKGLSSLEVSQLSIGVNRIAQSPQDMTLRYSQGCQTELVMIHDVGTDTRKIMLDSSIQSDIYNLDMYSQTEVAFMKNKNIQTSFMGNNGFTQTEKPKLRSVVVQTPSKLYSDKCQQALRSSIEYADASTETEMRIVYNQGTSTEYFECNEVLVTNTDKEDIVASNGRKEKSESPPLTPDKAEASPSSPLMYPFVSLFNPLAVRLPTIGT